MTRTKKGRPAPGKEHWSRRPGTFKDDKDITHRMERAEAKKLERIGTTVCRHGTPTDEKCELCP